MTTLTLILLALLACIYQTSSLTSDSRVNPRFYASKTNYQHEHEAIPFYRHVHLVPAVEYVHLRSVVHQDAVPQFETNRNTLHAKLSKTADQGTTKFSKTSDEARPFAAVPSVAPATKCECAPPVALMMLPASTAASTNLAAWNNDITETILASVRSVEELDEALAQMQPPTPSVACNLKQNSNINNGHNNNLAPRTSPVPAVPVQPVSVVGQKVALDALPIAVTNDGPPRSRRSDTVVVGDTTSSPSGEPFGMPVTPSPSSLVPVVGPTPMAAAPAADAMDEDFVSAGKELKQIYTDLDRIVENLEKENHRVHSTLFKALRAYVASIQKRIEYQQKAYADAKATGIRQKILVLKAKINETILKLKLKLTLRPLQTLTHAHGNALVTTNVVNNNVELPPATSNVVFNGPVNQPDLGRTDSALLARPVAATWPASAVNVEAPVVAFTPLRSV